VKKIISITLVVIALILFTLSIMISFLAIDAKSNNRLLYIFDYSFSMIPTDSMEGVLDDSLFPGDIAIIKNVPYSEISIGDVIVFQDIDQNGRVIRLIIHRIIGEHEDGGFETKGDNVNSPDRDNVTELNYLGYFTGTKVTFMRPIVLFLANSRHIVFLGIAVILLFILFFEVLHIFKMLHEEKIKKLTEIKEAEIKEMEHEKDNLYKQILEEEIKKKNSKK